MSKLYQDDASYLAVSTSIRYRFRLHFSLVYVRSRYKNGPNSGKICIKIDYSIVGSQSLRPRLTGDGREARTPDFGQVPSRTGTRCSLGSSARPAPAAPAAAAPSRLAASSRATAVGRLSSRAGQDAGPRTQDPGPRSNAVSEFGYLLINALRDCRERGMDAPLLVCPVR